MSKSQCKKFVSMDKQAMAIQHAVNLMRRGESSDQVLNLGIQISNNILLPLVAELALKGLKQKETTSDKFKKTHDLLKLFQDVSSEAQGRVDKRFRWYMSQDNDVKNNKVDLWQFFEKHKNDFVGWRYLEDKHLEPAYKEFQYAICAILDEVYGEAEEVMT